MNDINISHIKALYKFLDHDGAYSRMGAVDVETKQFENILVKGEAEVIDYAKCWNGQRNVFISRNPRGQDGAILYTRCVSFDVDPIRPNAGKVAATLNEHNLALNAGRRILALYPKGYLCSSGNGCLLLYHLPTRLYDLDVHYRREGILIDELNQLVSPFNCKLDSTNYDNAVIKLLGTTSTKGDTSLRRVAKFISYPVAPYLKCDSLVTYLSSIQAGTEVRQIHAGDPVKRIQDARSFLTQLSAARRDNYEEWLKVGMALKEFGISGLSLWKEWSKPSEKYEENICEEKWKTFDEVPKISLGSLAYWSKQDSENDRPSVGAGSYFNSLFEGDLRTGESIRTGFQSLDKALGSLPKGELTTFAARSGFGKTTFACTAAENLRKRNARVLYFSTEMSVEYIMHKFVALACNIPLARVITKGPFSDEETIRIRAYEQELLRTPMTICDEFQPDLKRVEYEINNAQPDVIIFDHISQIATNWQDIATFVRQLKEITSRQGCVTIMLSQLNEPPRQKDGSVMQAIRGDVRGSQEVIFLSAIFMVANNMYETKTNFQPVQVEICKNRYGLSGIKVEMQVNTEIGAYLDA